MRTLQWESNEGSYWWLDGEAPKNTSRNVGHGRRVKRSCQTLRGVSQEAPVRNANVWTIVLDHNTASKNRSFVREVQDGRTQTRQYYENPGKNTINVEGKRISNYSNGKSVVAKLKKAGQPRHKIIQITGHANECSLDDYDEVDEGERRTLSHTISGYSTTSTTTRGSETPPGSSSLSVPPTSAVVVLPSNASPLSSAAAVPLPTHQTSLLSSQIPVSRSANDQAAQHFNNCTVNIQNYFGRQSTNQASSSRVEFVRSVRFQ